MIKIAFCDDEQNFLDLFKKKIDKLNETGSNLYDADFFQTPDELLARDFGMYDIIFLDIEMSGQDGLSVAKKLRNEHYDHVLVFLTAFDGYAIQGYEVQAFRYLVKPASLTDLKACLTYAIEEKEKRKVKLYLKLDKCKVPILEQDLLYIEMFGHQMKLHTTTDTIEIRESLRTVEKQLSDVFFKVHKSYIVNLEYIKHFDNNEILLTTGAQVPLSRNNIKEFKERITGFWGAKINE